MLPTKFWFIWPSGFRGEDFFKSANQKQELPVVAMFVNGSGQNVQSLERTAHRCFLPSKRFQRRILKISQSDSETRIACGGIFGNGSGQNEQSL
jgi:hypothetical protein